MTLTFTGTTSSEKIGAATTPRDGMSRTASGSDINEKTYSLFFPIEKLAKVISINSHTNRFSISPPPAQCSNYFKNVLCFFDIVDFTPKNSTRMRRQWDCT